MQTEKTLVFFQLKRMKHLLNKRGLRQGVFSHFLLKGLKGDADVNNNNEVTINEISSYVQEQVTTYTNNYQRPIVLNSENNESVISEIKDD